MKKAAILFFSGIILILSSCNQNYYSVLITNLSSAPVRYEYDGSADVLAAGEAKAYSVAVYTQAPRMLGSDASDVCKVDCTVVMRHGDANYEFSDAEKLILSVVNNLAMDITIKAENYIDNGGDIGLTVKANSTNSAAFIYTALPIFSVTIENYEYSAQATYTIDDKAKTMFVVIK